MGHLDDVVGEDGDGDVVGGRVPVRRIEHDGGRDRALRGQIDRQGERHRGDRLARQAEGVGVARAFEQAQRGRRSRVAGYVVVEDGAHTLRVGDGGVGRIAEVNEEGLVGLDDVVAVDGDGDCLGEHARDEGQCAAGRDVVSARGRRVVRRGVVHRDGAEARLRERDCEHCVNGRAAVAFGHADIVNREVGHVVVEDSAHTLRVGDGGVDRVAQVDEEGLVYLNDVVAVDGDRDCLGEHAGSEDQRAAGRDVVHAGGCGAVRCGVVYGDRVDAGLGERDCEHCVNGRASVAFGHADIVDRDVGHVVVEDGAHALRVGDRGVGRAAQVDEERLIQLDGVVAVDGDRDRLADHARGEGQRAAGRDIVHARGRRVVSRGIVHCNRVGAGIGHGDGEDGVNSRAAVALGHADIIDRQNRVVIQDSAHALRVGDGGVGRIAQVDEERLVRFGRSVAVDGDGDGLGEHARGERQRAARRHVVNAGGRRAVRCGVVHRDGEANCC